MLFAWVFAQELYVFYLENALEHIPLPGFPLPLISDYKQY